MEKGHQVRRSISLPVELDDRLTALAERYGGKRSRAVAALLRGEVVMSQAVSGKAT